MPAAPAYFGITGCGHFFAPVVRWSPGRPIAGIPLVSQSAADFRDVHGNGRETRQERGTGSKRPDRPQSQKGVRHVFRSMTYTCVKRLFTGSFFRSHQIQHILAGG